MTYPYNQNFDTLTAGAAVAGWFNRSGSNFVVVTGGNVSSPNAFGETSPVDGDRAIYTAAGTMTDGGITFSQAINDNYPTNGNTSHLDACLRMDSAANNGYLVAINYLGTFGTLTQHELILYKISGSGATFTQIGTAQAISGTYANGQKVFVRAAMVGTQVQYKLWTASGSEPASFTAPSDWVDGTYTSGYAGVRYNHSAGYTPLGAIDDVSIDTLPTSAPAAYALSGSLSGAGGVPNTLTLTSNGYLAASVAVTVSVTAGNATLNGGAAPAVTVTLPAGSTTSATCTVQSSPTGNSTLHFTNAGSLSNPADATYTNTAGSVTLTLSGPSAGAVGNNSAMFLLTPSTSFAGRVLLTDGNAGGTFYPPALTWSASSAPQSFVYRPALAGSVTLAPVLAVGSATFSPASLPYAAQPGTFSAHPSAQTAPLLARSGNAYDDTNLAAPSVWANTLCKVDLATGKLTTSAVGGTVIKPKWLMQYSAYTTAGFSVGGTTVPASTWTLAFAWANQLSGPWTPLAPNTSAFNGGNPVDVPQAGEGNIECNGGIQEFTFPSSCSIVALRNQTLLAHYYNPVSFLCYLMTSPDGMTWTRWGQVGYTPLTGKTYSRVGSDPQARVLSDGTMELMCYNVTTSYDNSNYLCRATSSDGVNFTQTAEYFTENGTTLLYHMGEPAAYQVPGDSSLYFTFDGCAVGHNATAQRRTGLATVTVGGGVTFTPTANLYGAPQFMSSQVFDAFPLYASEAEGPRVYLFHAGGDVNDGHNGGKGSNYEMYSQIGLAYLPITTGGVTTTVTVHRTMPRRGRN